MINNITSIQDAVEEANLPQNSKEVSSKVDDSDIYELINRFYTERGDFEPEEYDINLGDQTEEISTCLLRPDKSKLSIDKISPTNLYHSHFSARGLEAAAIDKENSWNGEMAALQYDDSVVKLIKSDYYTTATFGELPYIEVANVLNEYQDSKNSEIPLDELSLRNSYLCSKSDIEKTKWLASGGSVGGAILAKSDNGWRLILGERSDKTRLNSGRYSIVPNGALRYENVLENGFLEDLEQHFSEELFRGQKEPKFFEDYVEPYRVSAGWNARDCSLSVGYCLLIRDTEGYKKIIDDSNYNFEFSDLINIGVTNFNRITDTVNMESMSPSLIPIVIKSLAMLEEVVDEVEIPYQIERR